MIKEYKCHQLYLKKLNKKYRLPYLYSKYQKLENQEYKYISKLRRIGKKLKRKNGIWHLLVTRRKFSLKTKLRVIEKIFNIKESDNVTILKAIKHNFEKTSVKSTTSVNYNNYINILDVLALYYITDGYDYNILNHLKVLKIQKYEVSNDISLIDIKDNCFRGYNLNKVTDEEVKNFQKKHKKATKRWKNSKTYRLNEVLRSFDKRASEWCYVDTTNSFYFQNKKYNIENVDQYKVKDDNKCEMDFILVLEDSSNELCFFDMNIESLDKNKIIERDD